MGQWEEKRASIKAKGVESFRFPDPVAGLLAAVFEPRSDGKGYTAPLEDVIKQSKTNIISVLNEMAESGVLNETGKIEDSCLDALAKIRKVAVAEGAEDIIQRLDSALAVSRGDASDKKSELEFRYPTFRVPEPKRVREGRPPVGRWR